MHDAIRLIVLLLFLSWTHWGCSGSPNLLKEIPTTVNTVKSAKGHIKQVGLVLIHTPNTPVCKIVGERYLKTLGNAVRNENSRLNLLTPQDSEFPSFLAELAETSTTSIDAVSMSKHGRRAGYQGLITAAVSDIRPVARKTGMFWMRKTRYFIQYSVTVDLYDPYTAAKIVSEVTEGTMQISKGDYNNLKSGVAASIDDLNETIENVALDHGDRIGEALVDHQWKSAVVKVHKDRIFVPAGGSRSGLKKGDRLMVFEGRRLLENEHGGVFTAPGVQVGELQITAIKDKMIEAKPLNAENIQKGDIVIPVE
jgi:hypothetical protein